VKKNLSNKISRKGVSEVALAPHLRRKLKKRPRGKPFEKGNGFGIATRFTFGNQANPGGRPSYTLVSKASRAWLAAKVPGDPHERTGAEMIVEVLGEQALSGDRASAAEITDRAEGRAAVSIELSDGPDPIADLIAEMKAMSVQRGRPEGMVPYNPNAEDDDSEIPQLPS